MLLPGWREDTCTCGVSLHNGFLVQVICLRLHLGCGLGMCSSLPQFYFFGFFFSANRSNRAFSKLGGGFFLWYLFICVTHCVGAKVHEVMTLQNAKHGHLLLNSWSVSISQQPPAPCQRGGSPALSSKHRQKFRMQALVLGLLSIILCCWWVSKGLCFVCLCLQETEVASCSACPTLLRCWEVLPSTKV